MSFFSFVGGWDCFSDILLIDDVVYGILNVGLLKGLRFLYIIAVASLVSAIYVDLLYPVHIECLSLTHNSILWIILKTKINISHDIVSG